MSDQVTHPSPDELSAFNLGQLPPETASQVEDHISECESCCETLLGLASNDTFVALLKEAHQPVDKSEYATFVTENATRTKSDQSTVPETLTEHTRYEIVRLIGKGGMGDVFEARHRMMDRTVAIKVINHEFIRKPQAVDRFHREVKAAARLSHPNIVTAYDAEQAGDLHFLVMEYVDGIDLARLVKEQGALTSRDACDFVRQAAIGLQHAHEQGMVHRDIKPHNLMVTTDGTVKILDFGLASLAPGVVLDEAATEQSGELTAAGSIVGTPDFISPEQAKDAHQADIRSDIYSLGATLYYLLSGRAPFAEVSVIEKLKHHAEQEPVPLENLQIEIPDELADVIRKMMAKDPQKRYQTPQQVADALAPFVTEYSTGASETIPSVRMTETSGDGARHNARKLAWLAFFGFLCVLAGVFYIQLGKTTLKFEVLDSNIRVRFAGESVFFQDTSGSGSTFKVKPGDKQKFVIEQNGAVIETDSLVLDRGDKVVLRISVVEGEIKILSSKEIGIDRQPTGSSQEERYAGGTGDSGSSSEITEVGRFDGHKGHVYDAIMSPDGKYGISCGGDKTIRIWDLKTQEQLRILTGHEGGLFDVAVSGNGKLLASCGESGIIRLWNFPSGEFLAELKGHDGDVTELAFMPDGSHLLSFGVDKTLRLWDIESQQLDRTIPLGVWVDKVEPLWDNQRVMLSGAQSGNLGVVTYDLKNGEPLVPHVSDKSCLAVSSDGRKTLIGSITGPLKVQDMESGNLIVQLHDPLAKAAIDAAISPDGRFAITTTRYGTMYLWDLTEGSLIATAESETIGGSEAIGGNTGTVAFSPDGRYALTIGPSGGVTVWRLPDSVLPQPISSPLSLIRTTALSHYGQVIGMGFSADSKRIITGDGSAGRRLIRMFDTKVGWKKAEFKGLRDTARAISASPDGKFIAVGDMDSTIHLLDAKSLEEIDTIDDHGGWVECLEFSPDSRRLASGSTNWRDDGEVSVRMWDVATRKELWRQDLANEGNRGGVESLCFSPDGTQLVTAHFAPEQRISIWKSETGELIRMFGGPDSQISCVRFSPDGRFIATAHRAKKMLNNQWNDPENCVIRLYDATNGEELKQLRGHQGPVLAIELTPDGRYLVSGSGAGFVNESGVETPASEYSVRFWDLSTGEQALLQQMSKPIVSLSLSPDGSQLATSAGFNKSPSDVQLWRINGIFKQPDSPLPESAETPNYALQFDGDSTAVSLPIRYDGSHPVTLECTVRFQDSGVRGQVLFTDTHDAGFNLSLSAKDQMRLVFALRSETQEQPIVRSKKPFPFGETVHVAAVYSGEEIRLFVNGELQDSLKVPGDFRYEPSPMTIAIGRNPDGNDTFRGSPLGLIDEVRISKVARYDKDFTPAKRFEPDADTMALYHFDEGAGTIARDSSGNGPDGKIFGAKWVEWPGIEQGNSDQDVHDQQSSSNLVEIGRFIGHTGSVKWITVSPDGRYVASTSGFPEGDKSVRVWDLSTCKLVRVFAEEDMDQMLRAQFTRDGTRLWASGADGQARLWEIESGRELCRIHGTGGRMRGLELTPDGKHVVVACGGRWQPRVIAVHDAETGERIRILNSSTESAFPLAFDLSPDGRLVLCRFNFQIQLFEVESGELVRTLSSHQDNVEDASFSHDGRRIVSGGQDDIVRVWDVATGEQLREFHGHFETILSTVFTPDDRHVVSAGYDGTVKIWNVESAKLVTQSDLTLSVWRAVVTPDGKHIICGGGSQRDAAESSVQKSDFELRILQVPQSVWSRQLSPVESSDAQLIDSRVLLEEFRKFYAEQAPKERSVIEEKADPFTVALGVASMRVHSPGFLRVTRWQEAAYTRGEFDDAAARKRIESVLPKLKGLEVQLPAMTSRIVTQYESNPLSGARLELAAHLIQAAYDRVQPQKETSDTTGLGFQWARIPAGTFRMGTVAEHVNALPPDENWFFAGFVPHRRRAETPQHRVVISTPFEMSKYEVTVAQFRRFILATGYKTTAEREGYGYGYRGEWEEGDEFDWQNPGFEIGDEHPVINVSWDDAVAFCEWMSSQDNHTYRLPTESEWEYACRAGTTTLFSTGDDPDSLKGFANLADATLHKQRLNVNWAVDWEDGFAATAPVGSFKPNAFDLYDMHGNAWEWCQDVYDTEWYETSPETDPLRKGSSGTHVFRGGGFDNWPGFLRSADRYSSHSPTLRSQWAGFRIVREMNANSSNASNE